MNKPLSELLGEPEPTTEGYDEMARRLRALDLECAKAEDRTYADQLLPTRIVRRILDGGKP